MHAYKVYMIRWDDHIIYRVDIECDDDEAAKKPPNCSSVEAMGRRARDRGEGRSAVCSSVGSSH